MSSKTITFAVYADTHLGQFADQRRLEAAFELFNRLRPSIQLLIHLGDITDKGSIEEWRDYVAARKTLKMKTVEILGNHDLPLLETHAEEVKKTIGDVKFAREFKGWAIGGITDDTSLDAWTELLGNLEDLARTGRRLVFVHRPPPREFIEDAADAGVRAIFYGHRHCTRVQQVEGVEVIGTPAALFGGIDNSPAAVRLIHCKGSRLWVEMRPLGMKPLYHFQSTVLRPDGGGRIELVAYDPVNPVKKVTAMVGEGRNRMPMPLKPYGAWSHLVRLPTGLKKPENLRVEIQREGADSVEMKSKLVEKPFEEPLPGEDWPHPRLNREGNAFLEVTRIGTPKLLWTGQLPGLVPGGGSSNPVIASSKLFLGISDFSGNSANGVIALSLKNGRLLWKNDTDGQVRGGCSYGVLVGSEGALLFNDILGKLHCISAEDGTRKWNYSYQNIEGWVHTAPLVEQGRVYAGTARELVCLSIGSGQRVWRAPRLGKDWMVSLSGVIADDKHLYIGLMKHGLVAFDKRTGKIAWQLERDKYGCVYAPPIKHEDKIYAGTDAGYAVALDAASGKVAWATHISSSAVNNAPVTDGEKLYFGTLSGSVLALTLSGGDIQWQVKTRQAIMANATYRPLQPSISSSPVLTGDILHAAAMDGFLRGYNTANGQVVYSVNCGGPMAAGLCISGNALYATTYDGRVMCLAFPEQQPMLKEKKSAEKKPARKRRSKKKKRSPVRKRATKRKKR